jgi:hypothetical protein
MALTGLALAMVAAFAVISSLSQARDGDVVDDRQATPGLAARPSIDALQGGQRADAPTPLAATRAELRVRVADGDLPPGVAEVLEVVGWLPGEFDWAAVDVLAATVPVASVGRQVSPDGTFSATLLVPSSRSLAGGLLVRLSGVGDPHAPAVPLATVTMVDSLFDGGSPDRRGYVLQ